MAWIESHQSLANHPKVLGLASLMGWDIDSTIGKLQRFWWWCIDYAPDGDLRRFSDLVLANAAGVAAADAKRFIEAMVNCGGEHASGFIDREPYLRVHDWWDYVGKFLQIKWKNHPEKWQQIRHLYANGADNGSNNGCCNALPTIPTKPNQPTTCIALDDQRRCFTGITEADFAAWNQAYPACDVPGEIRRAVEWAITNPKKRKKNWGRFLTSWLGRVQERGGSGAQQPASVHRRNRPYMRNGELIDPNEEKHATPKPN